jgi:hypothetical protein
MSPPASAGNENAYAVIRLMAACASAVRLKAGVAIAASVAVIIPLRSIIAAPFVGSA